MRAETSIPVTNRKNPTPPMQPMRMCRGKKLTNVPSLKPPSKRNMRPVRIELRQYEVMVVAMIASGDSPSIRSIIEYAILWKKGTTSIISEPTPPLKVDRPKE